MMKIEILDYTENPLTVIGDCARRCWNSPKGREVTIAKECMESGHGRVSEFADITIELSECSARVIREIYTHIVGTSRLQESTRYVDMSSFDYIMPKSIEKNVAAWEVYVDTMSDIRRAYSKLLELGIPKEDCANILPLGSHSKMILKINVRALFHLAHERLCTRAYWEIQDFVILLKKKIYELGGEWRYISQLMQPECEYIGYCKEKHSCGRYLRREEFVKT